MLRFLRSCAMLRPHAMTREEQPDSTPYLSIPEIWEMYQKRDRPLNGNTIQTILAPLTGTSYFQRLKEQVQTILPDRPVHALDMYQSFYYQIDTHWNDPKRVEEAVSCLAQLSGCTVPAVNVYMNGWMEPDELMFREYRRDHLFLDTDHTEKAGSHRIAQFWLYKAGMLRAVLPFSMIKYVVDTGERIDYREFAALAEGVFDHAFFTDAMRRPLLALDPRQQELRTSLPLLYISPQFSLDAALPV